MQNFSLHTHTNALDGQSSVLEMSLQANRIGYTCLGISDHFIVHPLIKESQMYRFAMKPKNPNVNPYHQIYSSSFEEAVAKIRPVYDEIDKLQEKKDIVLYKGLEVDFFEYKGWSEGFEWALDVLKPDYVIGACHFSVYNNKLLNMHDILKASSSEQEKLVNDYWIRQQKAIKSRCFNLIAHIDLYKRHSIGISEKFFDLEEQTMALLKENNTVAEINTSSLNKNKYRTEDFLHLLNLIAKFEIPTLLSDDAHHISQLGQNYPVAYEMAKKAHISHFCSPALNGKNLFLKHCLKEKN